MAVAMKDNPSVSSLADASCSFSELIPSLPAKILSSDPPNGPVSACASYDQQPSIKSAPDSDPFSTKPCMTTLTKSLLSVLGSAPRHPAKAIEAVKHGHPFLLHCHRAETGSSQRRLSTAFSSSTRSILISVHSFVTNHGTKLSEDTRRGKHSTNLSWKKKKILSLFCSQFNGIYRFRMTARNRH
ncbi:hypothetical protein MUK42_37329 [Musa troglodytarum]|uniref:Uncharacterized protein n=1 Tax=Musa troglodytarum TaxID=320322 RepID=A0A9E7I923_9LILI|nr:hypothetical protein MUK42_37329 [Musa troglodytarum]